MASSRTFPTLLVLALIAAAGGGYYYYQRNRTAQQPPSYNTTAVARGTIRQLVTATGQLDPLLSVDVGSQISGLVQKLYVDFNTEVTKGQKLAEIDPATYRQRLRQAEANLASNEAANKLQRLNTERTRELRDKQLVSQQDYDQAVALLQQSDAQLLTSKATVENARVDLERCTISSPIDGIVISKQTEEGKTVAASLNAPVLFTIANDLAKMQITAAVAESDIGSVQQGQRVTFTVDAFPGRDFSGQVTQVRNAPKTVSNVVTYDTIINVDNKDLKLRPGMTANVSIIVASRENILRLPNAALRVRLPEGVVAKGAPTASGTAAQPAVAAASAPAGTPAVERRPGGGGGGSGGGEGNRRGGGGMFGADLTPEQREKINAVRTELGISNPRDATPEQRDLLRKTLIERGIIAAPAAPGEPVITIRTVYRLPGGNKLATPEAVSVKVGITDGVTTELIDGLAEGDTIITGVTLPTNNPASGQPTNNPFGGQRRF
jgi:HlyD family secretion protein